VQQIATKGIEGLSKGEKISPQIVNNLEIVKDTFVEMS
jgi:hypothetical protein